MKKLTAFAFLLLATSLFSADYYIDYVAGSDVASASKSAPWKRAPGMVGFAGKYTSSSGDRFIFKGGVVWPAICFPMPLVSGNVTFTADQLWYSGIAFTRPVFDGEYRAPRLVFLNSKSFVTFDNLELKRINPSQNFGYGLIDGGFVSNILIRNCYLHGWRTSASTDDAHGGVIMVYSGVAIGMDTVVIDSTEVENAENNNNGVCVRSVGTIRNGSKIHHNSSGVLFCLRFEDSELYAINGRPFDNAYHCNGIYMDPAAFNLGLPGYIGRSFLHDAGGGANLAYPNVRGGASILIEDSVLYGTMSAQLAVEVEPFQYSNEGPGDLTIRNTTIVNYTADAPAVHIVDRSSSGQKVGVLTIEGVRVIGAGARITDATPSTANTINLKDNVVMTVAEATAAGFTLANRYLPAGALAVVSPVPTPPVVTPPVIAPPKIISSVSTISTDGKSITTKVTFDKSIKP